MTTNARPPGARFLLAGRFPRENGSENPVFRPGILAEFRHRWTREPVFDLWPMAFRRTGVTVEA
jgi:hypothetical protein